MQSGLKNYQESCKKAVAEEINGKRRAIVHVRGKGGRILATLLAVREDGQVYVGWSKCNKADPFNRSVGILKAYKRKLPLEEVEAVVEDIKTHGCGIWFLLGSTSQNSRNMVLRPDEVQVPHVVARALPEFVRRVREKTTDQGGE